MSDLFLPLAGFAQGIMNYGISQQQMALNQQAFDWNRMFSSEESARNQRNFESEQKRQQENFLSQMDFNQRQFDYSKYTTENRYQIASQDLAKAGINPVLAAGAGAQYAPVSGSASSGSAGSSQGSGNQGRTSINPVEFFSGVQLGIARMVAQAQAAEYGARQRYYDALANDVPENRITENRKADAASTGAGAQEKFANIEEQYRGREVGAKEEHAAADTSRALTEAGRLEEERKFVPGRLRLQALEIEATEYQLRTINPVRFQSLLLDNVEKRWNISMQERKELQQDLTNTGLRIANAIKLIEKDIKHSQFTATQIENTMMSYELEMALKFHGDKTAQSIDNFVTRSFRDLPPGSEGHRNMVYMLESISKILGSTPNIKMYNFTRK